MQLKPFFVLPLLVLLTDGAQAQASLSVVPNQAPAGATVAVHASGLGNGNADFWLTDGGSETALGSAASIRGAASLTAELPTLPSGPYTIEARQHGMIQATTPLTIQAAAPLTLSPVEGKPRSNIQVSANGLAGDIVTISYDGELVYGPQSLLDSSLEVSIQVPQSGNPGAKQVLLRTRIGRTTVDLATGTFNELPFTPILPPRVENVQFGFDSNLGRYQASGRLIPRESESLEDYEISFIFISDDGTTVPLRTEFQANPFSGQFSVELYNPHPINNDAIYAPGYAGDVAIAIVVPGRSDNGEPEEEEFRVMLGQVSFITELLDPIRLRIADLQGRPIENAVVQVQSLVPLDFNPVPQDDGSLLQSIYLANGSSDQYNGPLSPVQDYPVHSCGYLLYKEITDASGEVQLQIDPADLYSFAFASFIQSCDAHDPQQPFVTCDGQYLQEVHIPLVIRFSALFQGYGWNVDNAWVGGAYVIMLTYFPGSNSGEYDGFNYPEGLDDPGIRDPKITEDQLLDLSNFTVPVTPDQTLEFRIPEIVPDPDSNYRLGSALSIDGLNRTTVENTDTFRGAVSLRANDQATSAAVSAENVRIRFVESGIEGALSDVTLFFDGQEIGPFSESGELQCGDTVIGANSTQYEAFIPASMVYDRNQGEVLGGRVEATAFGGQDLTRSFNIHLDQVIPNWINGSSDYFNREVIWNVGKATLLADERMRSADVAADVPYDVGTLNNMTMNGGSVIQELSGELGTGDIRRLADSMNEVASTAAQDEDVSAPSVPNNGVVQIGPIDDLLFDTGNIPLFRYGWGVWPIAEAYIGADIWLKAGLIYETTIRLFQEYYYMRAEPYADIGLDLFFDVSMILDFVEASAHAIPYINIRVPVEVENGNETISDCFGFFLDMAYEVSVGVSPLEVSVSDTTNLISEEAGSCLNRDPQYRGVAQAPSSRPSLAFSESGVGLMSYFTDQGRLQVDRSVLGELDDTYQFPLTPGLMQVELAFLDAETALAVGARSALSEQDFRNSSFDAMDSTVTRSQHIVFAEYFDGEWSDFMPLTQPGTGEGGPVIATCNGATRTSCAQPRAIAVWVRDMAGDISAYRTQLYYSIYQNGLWTFPTPVDPGLPPDATVKDGQPAVTWWDNGNAEIPVIAWVRNPVGDIAQLHTRQLMYRMLDGSHMPEPVPGPPEGAASPSLAPDLEGGLVMAFTVAQDDTVFLGDQRTLHKARYVCDPGCAWTWNEVLDEHGRAIKAEKPKLVLTRFGTLAMVRVLGFQSPNGIPASLPGDALGALSGTGDIYPIYLHAPELDEVPVALSPLTFDGQINWEVAAAFDPNTGVNVAASTGTAIGASLQARLTEEREAARKSARSSKRREVDNAPTVLLRATDGPDFAIRNFKLVNEARPGESFQVTLQIVNLGAPVGSPAEVLDIAFAYDGRDGYVNPALVTTIPVPTPSASHTFSLSFPAGFQNDENHSLTATIRRTGRVTDDLNNANNSAVLQLGLLPPPSGLRLRTSSRDNLNHLSWDSIMDERIVGYRIYRSMDGGPRRAVGSSLTTEWADTRHAGGGDVRYWITGYSARGVESPVSAPTAIAPANGRLFRDGFED